uniref:ADP-ribosyl cyclase/cyclic ADP-ribose hydrolase n=1 Tax=Nymphaea colorata TaxID=210225 RepID=A0A5K0XK58_9MAGN
MVLNSMFPLALEVKTIGKDSLTIYRRSSSSKLHGINTFIDSENLEKCEEIKRLPAYIKKSKICVPIFSKAYVDSKWCLKELAKVVECNKMTILVFLDMDLLVIKKQSGPYTSAFQRHEPEEQLKPEEVRKWKEALKKVENISGFTRKDTDGYV